MYEILVCDVALAMVSHTSFLTKDRRVMSIKIHKSKSDLVCAKSIWEVF